MWRRNSTIPLLWLLWLGFVTGIFGGILRDIFCNRMPMVLRKELYASVSLLVALLYLGLKALQINHDINLLVSFTLGLSVRLAAIRWSWQLPVFSYSPGSWTGKSSSSEKTPD